MNKNSANDFDLLAIIEKTFPIPDRFRAKLPGDIAELSRLLTSARGERNSGYLNQPTMISAYIRYFLPWNVFRLQRLFSLPGTGQYIVSSLSPDDAITDLGSGPLTLPIALWITFPELRSLPLEFRCVDKSAAVLDAGFKLWKAIIAASPDHNKRSGEVKDVPWKIKCIHASIEDTSRRGTSPYRLGGKFRGKPAKLVSALNVFNEVFYKGGAYLGNTANGGAIAGGAISGGLTMAAKKAAILLQNSVKGAQNAIILVAEPGNPQGGTFIAALREVLLENGLQPLSPCPHAASCPMPGTNQGNRGKAKWCHFAFETDEAPLALQKLSTAAGIPKERATISFLLAGLSGSCSKKEEKAAKNPENGSKTPENTSKKTIMVRITSDIFPLLPKMPQKQENTAKKGIKSDWGRYACSKMGLALVLGGRSRLETAVSGTILELPLPANEQRDRKSGALILPLPF